MSLSEKGKLVFHDRYAIDGETWNDAAVRVGLGTAGAELPEKQTEWTDKFGEMIHDLYFLPGGRIMRGVGRPMTNLLNCFALEVEDSMESIGETIGKMWQISAEGGGCGISFAKVRPGGSYLSRKDGIASGPVSFMRVYDVAADVICSGGFRRAALKIDLPVWHPEIINFIEAKLDNSVLNNCNISVAITKQFIEAVRKNKKWELRFGGKVYEKIKARELWMMIMEYMVKCGEPGLINLDNLIKNNSWYFAPIVTTNPCGELPLECYGSCCLGHINLAKFVTEGGRTKWQEMGRIIHLAVRFLDNIIGINNYFLPQCREAAFRGRRIGLGILGFADYLFAKEIRYGSEESIKAVDELGAFLRNESYAASIELAKEKGAFQAFDRENYCSAKFIKRLPRHLQRRIYERGIRNVTLNTIAPTGTVSLLAGVSSGCEPLFKKAYKRKDRIKKGKERVYIHDRYKEILLQQKDEKSRTVPEWYVDAFDITPFEHLEVQRAFQDNNDGAISKTINCPSGTTGAELSRYLLRYIGDLKGVTVYVDGSRKEQVLYPLSDAMALRHLETAEEVEIQNCTIGVCDV